MNKILTLDKLKDTIKDIKKSGPIILVGGCFDVLHVGHIEFLRKSKELGGTLIVILESDKSVKARKGSLRPINSQKKRAQTLSKIPYVNYVLSIRHFTTDSEYISLVNTLEPAIIAVTQGDPIKKMKEIQAKMVGGRVVEVMDRDTRYSTSTLLKK